MPKKLLIATTNTGKIKELNSLFGVKGLDLCTLNDLSISIHVEETGKTYSENAYIKAHAYCQASGLPTLADDTGLEVEALGGAPGLFSARFSPKPNATDADRRALLLRKLRDFPHPWTARFVCAMALVFPDGRVFESKGICMGEIIGAERGDHGFGYDRLFLCKEARSTMAELQLEEKNHISHRAHAAKKIRPFIQLINT